MSSPRYRKPGFRHHAQAYPDGTVFLANDDDDYYCQWFHSWQELNVLIDELRAEGLKAWGPEPGIESDSAKE